MQNSQKQVGFLFLTGPKAQQFTWRSPTGWVGRHDIMVRANGPVICKMLKDGYTFGQMVGPLALRFFDHQNPARWAGLG